IAIFSLTPKRIKFRIADRRKSWKIKPVYFKSFASRARPHRGHPQRSLFTPLALGMSWQYQHRLLALSARSLFPQAHAGWSGLAFPSLPPYLRLARSDEGGSCGRRMTSAWYVGGSKQVGQ